jgi:hypothetical protein
VLEADALIWHLRLAAAKVVDADNRAQLGNA